MNWWWWTIYCIGESFLWLWNKGYVASVMDVANHPIIGNSLPALILSARLPFHSSNYFHLNNHWHFSLSMKVFLKNSFLKTSIVKAITVADWSDISLKCEKVSTAIQLVLKFFPFNDSVGNLQKDFPSAQSTGRWKSPREEEVKWPFPQHFHSS